MTKYKELVSFILDAIRAVSDDAFITEDHVIFLLNKYRSYLLKQKYEKDPRRQVPASNYQTVKLTMGQYGNTVSTTWDYDGIKKYSTVKDSKDRANMEGLKKYETDPEDPTKPTRWDDENLVKRTYLRSLEEIPYTMQVGISGCYIVDPFMATITMISKERLEFVGWNKFLQKIIYGAFGPDQHLYIKSNNPEFLAIKKVIFHGILEDPTSVMDDAMEEDCPIEEALVAPLIKSVIADLLQFEYRPQDPANNANDDLSDINLFIRNNMKKDYNRDYLDGENE